MSEPKPPAPRDDLLTICAIGVLAACLSTLAHEAMGHGTACLVTGGRVTRLTNVYFQCSRPGVWVSPAGPLGNYAAAILAWIGFALTPPARVRLRLLLAMVGAFSLFWEAGYLLFAAVKRQGDYVVALSDFHAPAWWPWIAAAAGLVLYVLGGRLLGRAGAAFAPQTGGPAGSRAARLFIPAYVAGALSAVAAAALYAPDRLKAMHQAALEIGLASFPLLFVARLVGRAGGTGQGTPPLGRSLAWIIAAFAVFAVFCATLGRGAPA